MCQIYISYPNYFGHNNLLGGNFWAMGRYNLLDGQDHLLGGPTEFKDVIFTALIRLYIAQDL